MAIDNCLKPLELISDVVAEVLFLRIIKFYLHHLLRVDRINFWFLNRTLILRVIFFYFLPINLADLIVPQIFFFPYILY